MEWADNIASKYFSMPTPLAGDWLMSDVEMECVAKWKLNAELFAVVRLHGAGFTRTDQRYRCLVSGTVKLSVDICQFQIASTHRRNNRRDRGETGPQLLGWGPTMYWSPNFLAIVLKRQEISQQVVTRMQDLASESLKIFREWYPQTLTAGGGDPLPHPIPSPAFGRARGASAPALGPKPWSPSTFQPWLRHCPTHPLMDSGWIS